MQCLGQRLTGAPAKSKISWGGEEGQVVRSESRTRLGWSASQRNRQISRAQKGK